MNRRDLLLGGWAGVMASSLSGKAPRPRSAHFSDLLSQLGPGGRLGVAARQVGTARLVSFHGDERFAFCSAFKLILAAAILEQVQLGRLALAEQVPFTPSDVLDYAPVVRAHIAQGSLPVETLARAAVEVSDNSAANLLLKRVGGPAGLTAFLKRLGDRTSRLDRWEVELNSNLPGDPRDTTTPLAMMATCEALLSGTLLDPAHRRVLSQWLVQASRGLDRLRAGVPAGWRAGNKAGTGANGANNDVAIIWPPGRRPLLIASFTSGGNANDTVRAAVHAEVSRRVIDLLA